MKNPNNSYDLVICGGGLAGLTLSMQVKDSMPGLSVLILEKWAGEIPDGKWKIGESASEIGSNYFAKVLGLEDYLLEHHFRKFGLRYYFGDSRCDLHQRSELGIKDYPQVKTYNVDRGRLERDLRKFAEEKGVTFLSGVDVVDIEINEGGERHIAKYKEIQSGQMSEVTCNWIIDATGRRRFLQRKLGLHKENSHNASSTWFRLGGRVDLEEMVPKSESEFHDRIPGQKRYFSTNHLMGHGYWVWLLPLATGNTSVGIVADDSIHPPTSYKGFKGALEWFKKHEPQFYEYIKDMKPIDNIQLRNFSYTSKKVFSADRWACVGEAGVFADPFYSPGSDLIAIANTFVTRMIALDRNQNLSPQTVETFNRLMIGINDNTTDIYRGLYHSFGTRIMTWKVVWDWAIYWGINSQIAIHGLLYAPEKAGKLVPLLARFTHLNQKIQQVFRDWAAKKSDESKYEYVDLFEIQMLKHFHSDLETPKNHKTTFELLERNVRILECYSLVMFKQAVKEVLPEMYEKVSNAQWLNAWGMSLSPEKWESQKLFSPETEPMDLSVFTKDQLAQLEEALDEKVELSKAA